MLVKAANGVLIDYVVVDSMFSGGGYWAYFLRSVIFRIFQHCQNTCWPLNITLTFGRCRSATMAHVKYECNSNNLIFVHCFAVLCFVLVFILSDTSWYLKQAHDSLALSQPTHVSETQSKSRPSTDPWFPGAVITGSVPQVSCVIAFL